MSKNKKLNDRQLLEKIDEFENLDPNDKNFDEKYKKILDDILPNMKGDNIEEQLYNFTCGLIASKYISDGYEFVEKCITRLIFEEDFEECALYLSISQLLLTVPEILEEYDENLEENICKHNALVHIFLDAREKKSRKEFLDDFLIPYTEEK